MVAITIREVYDAIIASPIGARGDYSVAVVYLHRTVVGVDEQVVLIDRYTV
jgi:hypothetical protein